MPQQPLRRVALFTLAVFLIANGLVNFVPLAVLASRPVVSSLDPHESCSHDCCCIDSCCCCDNGDGYKPNTTQTAKESPSPAHHCPCCPDCPANCCWCCAAKVPCCPPADAVIPIVVACPGDRLAEAALLFPAPLPVELLQPPRV